MDYLLEELCPRPVAAVLYKEKVLSLHEVSLVFSDQQFDRRSQVHQLIAIMKTKPECEENFKQALRKSFQTQIEDKLFSRGNVIQDIYLLCIYTLIYRYTYY